MSGDPEKPPEGEPGRPEDGNPEKVAPETTPQASPEPISQATPPVEAAPPQTYAPIDPLPPEVTEPEAPSEPARIEVAPPELSAPEEEAPLVEEHVAESALEPEAAEEAPVDPIDEAAHEPEPAHEPLVQFTPPPRYEPPPLAPPQRAERPTPPRALPPPVPYPRADEPSLFGEPDIPLPNEPQPSPQQARDAQRVLDLDLSRIKRTKRFGLAGTIFAVLFIALVLAPVTWVVAYRFIDAPGTVLMLQRASEGETIHHTPVPLARMSPYIIRSVIAAEDQNFCTHHGFDVEAIQNAMEHNEDGGRVRGGSTISQQTAKNLFLWPSRSWLRKGFETYFTSLTEFMWPKSQIMEQYLNAAEWGDGIFGIEAASEARFHVHASELSPQQAARLAAVLPSPNRWRVDDPGPYVRGRAVTIADRAAVVRNNGMASCVLALDPKPPAAR